MNEKEKEKIEASIQGLKEQIMYFEANKEGLVKALEKCNYLEDFEKKNRSVTRNSLESLIGESKEGSSNNQEALNQFYDYFFRLQDLAEQAGNFVKNETLIHKFSIKRYWESYRRQQLQEFLTWLHRLVRWGLGAAVAIIIYSTGAWLSDPNDNAKFFHMPIHDWLGKPQN